MTATYIIDVLSRNLPDAQFTAVESRDGMPTISVPSESLVDTCLALRDAPELRFAFLADLVPVDYFPREPRFEIGYVMACPGVAGYGDTPKRLRLKIAVDGTGGGSESRARVVGSGLRSLRPVTAS